MKKISVILRKVLRDHNFLRQNIFPLTKSLKLLNKSKIPFNAFCNNRIPQLNNSRFLPDKLKLHISMT